MCIYYIYDIWGSVTLKSKRGHAADLQRRFVYVMSCLYSRVQRVNGKISNVYKYYYVYVQFIGSLGVLEINRLHVIRV